jgi:hypothetical protein
LTQSHFENGPSPTNQTDAQAGNHHGPHANRDAMRLLDVKGKRSIYR